MLLLFAQTVESVPQGWERILRDYGFTGVLTAMVLWLMYRYVPRAIEGVLSLYELLGKAVVTNAESQKRTAKALRNISLVIGGDPVVVRNHPFSSSRVEKAMVHMTSAVEETVRDNPDLSNRVRPHLEAIREALKTPSGA